MAQRTTGAECSGLRRTRSGVRRGSAAQHKEEQIRAVKEILLGTLQSYEPLVTHLQAVLVWERPRHSALLHLSLNAAFWFFALTSLRIVFLTAFGLMIIICVDQWKNRIWPKLGAARSNELDNDSWGYVHPKLLSVPELCHHAAEIWVSLTIFRRNLLLFKAENPGKFCLLVCGFLTFLAVLGGYIPGILLSYLLFLCILLWPLALFHHIGQRVYQRLEPTLQRLDFSVRGYMMSKQNERLLHGRALPPSDESDSEEELAAFCPMLDDSAVAKELAISDSEHSDADVSCTENGTFNLSRGQTPLTEGSEDLDRHSDPEESFARDLPDFPSINPETMGIDDEDDTSIGLPLSASHRHVCSDQLYDEQESSESEIPLAFAAQQIKDNLTNLVTKGMIQMALAGVTQQASGFLENTNPKTYRRNSSSEMDTDAEADDFELLDQSELNQMDPTNLRGQQ
ncbi:reticulophagy regulator 3 isoform X2 [Rana temporaria]|uniref:reticulophagy regulator 3 isoform X2 n=1 Tax=Rana temporaria TaxID=8407 RepID=UPI001AAD03D2|nr:reticulophagy regulator 3 isoform X2 [Rana temporaria]